jgi:type I restriction-modification system DNA methylase subunit
MARPKKAEKTGSTANIGFEAKLWQAADKLRNNMDAGEYKHVVLGLIFLKYISDSFGGRIRGQAAPYLEVRLKSRVLAEFSHTMNEERPDPVG